MNVVVPQSLQSFQTGDATDPAFAQAFVVAILQTALTAEASDLHLLPTATTLEVHWRLDGVLQPLGQFPLVAAPNIVGRLKVLADLLTYYTDRPQEGRLRAANQQVEMRLSTFPTLYGEKAVIRLFSAAGQRFSDLASLNLPAEVGSTLRGLLEETSGALLITGPAGSGKTTTVYAALREIATKSAGGRSLVSLEDPIEAVVPGVAQSQVNSAAGLTLASGLRSLLRQDPEVILLGEIRDQETAQVACQAALTGQLLLSTFHAGSAAGAISRLTDMGIEPYILRSAVRAIVAQRLVRRLCSCAESSTDEPSRLGLPVESFRVPIGCAACRQTGYQGRLLLAELLLPRWSGVSAGLLARAEVQHLEAEALSAGMVSLGQRAVAAVAAGETSPAEVRRVLGWEGR